MKIDFEEVKNEFGQRASAFYDDNEKLGELIEEFTEKIKNSKILETVGDDLKLTLDMIVDWKNGDYEDLSKDSVTIIIVGFLYILSPVSLVPKFIPLEHLDDILVLVFVVRKIKKELEAYKKWKRENGIFHVEDEDNYIDIS